MLKLFEVCGLFRRCVCRCRPWPCFTFQWSLFSASLMSGGKYANVLGVIVTVLLYVGFSCASPVCTAKFTRHSVFGYSVTFFLFVKLFVLCKYVNVTATFVHLFTFVLYVGFSHPSPQCTATRARYGVLGYSITFFLFVELFDVRKYSNVLDSITILLYVGFVAPSPTCTGPCNSDSVPDSMTCVPEGPKAMKIVEAKEDEIEVMVPQSFFENYF